MISRKPNGVSQLHVRMKLNVFSSSDRVDGGNPGLKAIWEEEKHRREELGFAEDDMDAPLSNSA